MHFAEVVWMGEGQGLGEETDFYTGVTYFCCARQTMEHSNWDTNPQHQGIIQYLMRIITDETSANIARFRKIHS